MACGHSMSQSVNVKRNHLSLGILIRMFTSPMSNTYMYTVVSSPME